MSTPQKDVWTRKLQERLPEASVMLAEEDRICYAYDASGSRFLPDAIVRVRSREDVIASLELAREFAVPVYPRGAGTGLSGGAVPLKGGIVLDFSQMNKVLDLSVSNLTARVQPGIVVGQLEKILEEERLFFPPDPASAEFCTIGGAVAECAGGLRAVKYGVTRDYVLGLEAVLASGQIIHTGTGTLKDVAGYDLTRLLVGSEGTLGIFTEITLRLLPLPQCARCVAAGFDSETAAAEAATRIIASGLLPRALEFMDASTLDCVRNYSDAEVPSDIAALLLVESDGVETAVAEEIDAIEKLLQRAGASTLEVARSSEEREELWKIRRAISPSLYKVAPVKLNEDVCVPREKVPELLRMIENIRREKALFIGNYGHIGDGNLHVTIMVQDTEDDRKRAWEAVDTIMRNTVKMGGTISGEHGIGLEKASFLPMQLEPHVYQLMRQIKKIFDPQGILNPGKMLVPTAPAHA